jgi:hypothetical protein
MVVQVAYPPIIDELEKVFGPLKGRGILYAWGSIIFNPMGVPVHGQFIVHEGTHGARQLYPGMTIEKWWELYMQEQDFRMKEEMLAHIAEYQAYCILHKDRNLRAIYLDKVARKFVSPLYKFEVTYKDAKEFIRRAR